MKRRFIIGLFVLLALAACHRPVETQNFASLPSTTSPKLSAIDSLMWQRPDSALACLLPCFDTCCAAEHDRHYAHLLLSELLYKNDYAQTNRTELQDAVVYFDSLMQAPEPVEGPSKKQNVFLAARAHYINGVGYYEQDSTVPACQEYLKALETMEEGFEEKQLVGKKARFMALIYNRLGDMFENQLLAEPAIFCYKQALAFCKKETTSVFGIPILFYRLGIQFDILGQTDSAFYYYDKALANLPNHNNIHYRDIMANKAVLNYNSGFCSDSVINALKHIVSLSADEDERITRYLTLGNIFYEDKQYDSSLYYLKIVFDKQEFIISKILAAENLRDIHLKKGDTISALLYSSFLAEYTMMEIEKKADVSIISEMLKEYLNKKQEKQAEEARKQSIKETIEIIVPIAILITVIIFVIVKINGGKLLKQQQARADKTLEEHKKKHKKELESERHSHKMKQAALAGRLKRSNEALRQTTRQLEEALRQCLLEIYKSGEENRLERILAEFSTAYPQAMDNLRANHPDLTETERNIVILSFLGFRTKEEAEILGLSPNTVEKYRTNIRKKTENKPFFDLIG